MVSYGLARHLFPFFFSPGQKADWVKARADNKMTKDFILMFEEMSLRWLSTFSYGASSLNREEQLLRSAFGSPTGKSSHHFTDQTQSNPTVHLEGKNTQW